MHAENANSNADVKTVLTTKSIFLMTYLTEYIIILGAILIICAINDLLWKVWRYFRELRNPRNTLFLNDNHTVFFLINHVGAYVTFHDNIKELY